MDSAYGVLGSEGDVREWHYQPVDKNYVVREARTLRELDQVHHITHESIVHAGYMDEVKGGRLITYPHLDTSPLTSILIAVDGDRVIGTNSLTADGPLKLHTDCYFSDETDAVRAEGRRLISSFRIATDPTWLTHSSSALVMDIICFTFVLAFERFDFDTMLCTFNPKHENLYRRLLAARTLAHKEAISHGQVSAGAVLMRIDRESLPNRFLAQVQELRAHYLAPARRETPVTFATRSEMTAV